MLNYIRHPFTASLFVFAIFVGSPSWTNAGSCRADSLQEKEAVKEKKDKKDKKDEKDDKKDEAAKPSKQERKYQEIKLFSEGLYAKEPEFRDEVEVAYRQKQREHSEYAYAINTRMLLEQRLESLLRSSDKSRSNETLYDNPLVQDYVNRVGHSIVPKDSSKLYAFKVTLNPIPEARSLSTGTVYVSSGLLSLIDNEAQLAYILGHIAGKQRLGRWSRHLHAGTA